MGRFETTVLPSRGPRLSHYDGGSALPLANQVWQTTDIQLGMVP